MNALSLFRGGWGAALAVWAASGLGAADAAEPLRLWTSGLLNDPALWQEGARKLAAVGAAGVRLEIGPNHAYELIAQSGLQLPENAGQMRVRIRELGGGAAWFIKLRGDVRGTGTVLDVVPFHRCSLTGEVTRVLDPRLVRLGHRPAVQVQLGVQGTNGGWVLFEALDFLSNPSRPSAAHVAGQKNIQAVDWMPHLPQPYAMLDWQNLARDYDRFVFDFGAHGEFLPLIWLDHSHLNLPGPTFGLSSYVGDGRPEKGGSSQEGVTCLGAVLGATLAGLDKSRQDHDYVAMCEAFFTRRNGQNLVLNSQNGRAGGSFWYEIWPHVVFYGLADRYPQHPSLTNIMRVTADHWRSACDALKGPDGLPDFDHVSFNFDTMKAVDNGQWKEPDAAAGIAWLEFMAWERFHDPKSLEAAEACLRFLEHRKANPYYEVLLPWGAVTAVRLNAELDRRLDADKLLRWCFDISDCRGGWSVVLGNWGGYDCAGLLGSVDDGGGYAFAMNTFAQAGALTPLPRYDASYARAIGKWMLNLANAARLFYPRQLPPQHQTSAFWKGDPAGVIAYEGLRCEWQGQSPCATGDPIAYKWGPKTDLGLYGSSYVGFLGSIVRTSNVPGILQLNCLATDFFHQPAHPTWLYYNPHAEAREVELDAGPVARDLYDAGTHRFLARNVTGPAKFNLPPDQAAVLVLVPARAPVQHQGRKLLVDGIVVDFGMP